jgi:AcrR family transcriptional regulator
LKTQRRRAAKRRASAGKSAVGAGRAEPAKTSESSVRDRILLAAFTVFMDYGYAGASTLEIATRARVSKRELYSLFGNKQALLTACVVERTTRMRRPLELIPPRNRQQLGITLIRFGKTLLTEVSHPAVMAMHHLAVSEFGRSPQVARTLDANGRARNRAALSSLFAQAQKDAIIGSGDPDRMGARFIGLLWEDLLFRLVMRVADPPSPDEIDRRARSATEAILALYPAPEKKTDR